MALDIYQTTFESTQPTSFGRSDKGKASQFGVTERPVGNLDILIAATALVHELTLLTRHIREYQHSPDLKIFDR